MTTGTGNRGEWFPHGASLQGHQSSAHTHTPVSGGRCGCPLIKDLKWSPSLDCFHLKLQTPDAEWETEQTKPLQEGKSMHVSGIAAQTYLQCVTQAEWLCADSNWPTDLFQFETLALHTDDYSCYCGTADSTYRSHLSCTTITEISLFLSVSKQNK